MAPQKLTTIRIDSDFYQKIKTISEAKGISVTKYLVSSFGDVIEADYAVCLELQKRIDELRQTMTSSSKKPPNEEEEVLPGPKKKSNK